MLDLSLHLRERMRNALPRLRTAADPARRHYRWDGRIASHAADIGAITSTGFVRHRVIEAELPRVKCDRPQPLVLELLAECARRAVLRIADDGMSARRALNANLMRAASFKFHFEPRADCRSIRRRDTR